MYTIARTLTVFTVVNKYLLESLRKLTSHTQITKIDDERVHKRDN